MSWIITASGKRFDMTDPKPEQIDLDDIAHALSHVCRFGGHCRTHYSVAQHSVLVASMLPPTKGWRLMGLMHDSAEAYMGDIVSPVKWENPGLKNFEARIAAVIQRKFGVANWEEFEAIKHADLRALAAEKEDLVKYHPDPWPILKGVIRAPQEIRPLPANLAEIQWRDAVEYWLKQ